MKEFMIFLSSFSSYLFVFIIFVAVIAVGIALGITIRKLVDKNKAKKENILEETKKVEG